MTKTLSLTDSEARAYELIHNPNCDTDLTGLLPFDRARVEVYKDGSLKTLRSGERDWFNDITAGLLA